MSNAAGAGPVYWVITFQGGARQARTFSNPNEASSYFDARKAEPDHMELWLTRQGGGEWEVLALLVRSEGGEWVDGTGGE